MRKQPILFQLHPQTIKSLKELKRINGIPIQVNAERILNDGLSGLGTMVEDCCYKIREQYTIEHHVNHTLVDVNAIITKHCKVYNLSVDHIKSVLGYDEQTPIGSISIVASLIPKKKK